MKDIIENTSVPHRWTKFSDYDFYSGGVSLNVRGKDRPQHWLGTVITFLVYALMILASVYFFMKFAETSALKLGMIILLL